MPPYGVMVNTTLPWLPMSIPWLQLSDLDVQALSVLLYVWEVLGQLKVELDQSESETIIQSGLRKAAMLSASPEMQIDEGITNAMPNQLK